MKMPSLRTLLSLLALVGAATAAQSEVFKCKGVDGKVVFSDHACGTDQTGTAVPGIAKSATTLTPTSPNLAEALERYKRHQLQDAMLTISPECRELGGKAARTLRSDAGVEEIKRAVSEYDARCTPQMEQAQRNAKASPKSDPEGCRALRQARDDTREQLGRMSDKEKIAYAKLQNEVAAICP
jgi:Domain of unknown function (DUF4124)